jgi:hypothetical protein
MRPACSSFSARSRLIRDQRLRGRRGVKRCSQRCSSRAAFWPSIQPKQSAPSSASA